MRTQPIRKLTEVICFEEGVVPDEVGPFVPVTSTDVDWFNDFLTDEIESAYTSSICCCDACYDDFVAHWPDVSFRKSEFQKQSIELDLLIKSSRLIDLYSPAEISTLKRLAICPRCSLQPPCNIWIYEHRFSDVALIESSIDKLLSIGAATPFLMLEHPFARQVLDAIRDHAKRAERVSLAVPLYRARIADDVARLNQKPEELQTYAAAPAAFVAEGRYNHAGHPMVYLASSAETAAAELNMSGHASNIGRLRLTQSLRILDLFEIDEDLPGNEILLALASSALIAAPRIGEGWVKRQYIFSRFVADCAHEAGFDAIRYGSIKRSKQSNYVLLNPPYDFSSIATIEGHETLIIAPPEKRY